MTQKGSSPAGGIPAGKSGDGLKSPAYDIVRTYFKISDELNVFFARIGRRIEAIFRRL